MFISTSAAGKVFTDDSGVFYEIPVLLTANGHIDELVDYFVERWDHRSPAWMAKVANAVRLFLEYIEANPNTSDERRLFQNFRQRLLTGTIGRSSDDPSGLWWRPTNPRKAKTMIVNLTDFFNWWAERHPGKQNPASGWRGSLFDRRLAQAAYDYRRNRAFLGHTWAEFEGSSESSGGGRGSRGRHAPPKVEFAMPPSFPEDRILDLLFKGFKVGNRYNHRDMLITLLMNGAGFRASEPFHLYMWDVKEDPLKRGQALVLIHHPAWGNAPADPLWRDIDGQQRKGNRAQYLAERCGMAPRDWGLSKSSAGWKGGMHESLFGGYYKQAYWFVPEFGEIFWRIWQVYAEQVLRIDAVHRNHPFAFMNTMREPLGDIYKMGKFEESHAAAVRRIGLEPAKHLGTSLHGHRYAYGQRLRQASIPKETIRRFMHHADIESQEVYTGVGHAECLEHIEQGLTRLNSTTARVRLSLSDATRSGEFLGASL